MVNRIWQFRMGAGLVRTPNDFGTAGRQARRITQLLDWLAVEFMAARLERQDHRPPDRALEHLPAGVGDRRARSRKSIRENKLYWRMNRKRLEGEVDSRRRAGGGGRAESRRSAASPCAIPIEPEVYDLIFTEGEPDGLWPVTPDESEQYRRSLYLLNKRTRAPADAGDFRSAGRHDIVPGAAGEHARVAGALAVQQRLHAGGIASVSPRGWKRECGRDQALPGAATPTAGAGAGAANRRDCNWRGSSSQGPAAAGFLPGAVESK